MSTQQTSTRIFRVFAALAVLVLVFSQFVGIAQAEGPKPPTKERVQIAAPNLDEVQTYFGRLSQIQGNLGVVVELQDTPSALIYAQNQAQSAMRAADLAKAQTALIQQKQATLMSALQAKAIKYTELYRIQKVYNGIWLKLDSKDIPALLNLPGVKAIHPMIPKTVDHTTSVPLIGAPKVWGGLAGILGENIKVGIIDTGIDYVHTNFGGLGTPGYATQDFTTLTEPLNVFPTTKVVGGWDFAGDAYDAADAVPTIVPDGDPMDCNGHGSHVSGTVGGYGVLPNGTTYKESAGDTYSMLESLTSSQYIAKFRIGPGVAPKAQLYGLRVFGCSGSTDLTEQAIEWAMDPNNDGDFSDHLDVINMSLGSSFGSAYDASAVASNNAAQVGVIVVTSSGNSGDVYYIAGAPGMGKYTIDVANSVDAGAVVSAFEVKAPPAIAGSQPGVEASFGPLPGVPGTTGDIAVTTPANGCTAISTVLTGKIALIDRGTCTFKTKVRNAQNAGAIGVLVANNTFGFPLSMGDDPLVTDIITIPSMMTTQTVGNLLKAQLALPATVTIRLTSEFQNQFTMTDPVIEDTLVSSSSRGPARSGTLLKPDIAAPGDTIFSTATGTGDKGVSFGGTSMASPHVAGVMTLMRQLHPTWTVTELKALVMNTATNDVYTTPARTAKYTPTRIGAGRVSVANASQSDVVAYYTNDPGQVSVAFGEVEVTGTQDFIKSITLSNLAADPVNYNVAFDSRYQANPGLTFTLLNAGGTALVNPVTVPSRGTLQIQIQATVNAPALTRGRDATILTTGSRQRFSEGGGYVTFTSVDTAPALRLPVHIAARPASTMNVGTTVINLPLAASGTISLTPIGTPVDTVDDTSWVSILNLMSESPNDASSTGSNDAADLRYVGLSTNYPTSTLATAAAYFGVATYGKWDTSHAVEFDIYVDVDQDGVWDYVVFNTNQGFFTGTTDDVMFTAYCDLNAGGCDADYYTNGLSGTYNTNLFNNNVMVLPVKLASIGVGAADTSFDFQVVSFNREATGSVDTSPVMTYDVAHQSFYGTSAYGAPQWDDVALYSPTFTLNYNKADIAANKSLGLLLLHHHNDANTAEAVRMPPLVSSIKAASPNPTNSNSVDYTVTFTTLVTGVDAGDFFLTTSGVAGASITSVTGSGAIYNVKVNTGTKTGTIRLDVRDDDSILDSSFNRLGGMSVGNGDFTTGEVYSVFKPATFADVQPTYWAWGYIERLHAAGLTTGCRSTPTFDFCPEAPVTRAEMAVFLLRGIHGASYTPPAAIGNVFIDVKPGDFAAAWIEQLYTEGITSGCGASSFCPGNLVTRAEMAVFLLRAEHTSLFVPPVATGTLFSDVPAASFAADWIEQLAAEGITSGCGAGMYCPGNTVTRAQMAVFLVKTFKLP